MKDPRKEPPAVDNDPDAVEMASVWIANGGLHCSLKIGMYEEKSNIDERRAWGIMLADIIRHVSTGLEVSYKFDKAESNRLILESLIGELGVPTSEMRGGFSEQ